MCSNHVNSFDNIVNSVIVVEVRQIDTYKSRSAERTSYIVVSIDSTSVRQQ